MSERILKQFFEEQRLKRKTKILLTLCRKVGDSGRARRREVPGSPAIPSKTQADPGGEAPSGRG